jgi:hypothetical protein
VGRASIPRRRQSPGHPGRLRRHSDHPRRITPVPPNRRDHQGRLRPITPANPETDPSGRAPRDRVARFGPSRAATPRQQPVSDATRTAPSSRSAGPIHTGVRAADRSGRASMAPTSNAGGRLRRVHIDRVTPRSTIPITVRMMVRLITVRMTVRRQPVERDDRTPPGGPAKCAGMGSIKEGTATNSCQSRQGSRCALHSERGRAAGDVNADGTERPRPRPINENVHH